MMNIGNCGLIEFTQSLDLRGQLTYMESNKEIPFDIKRIYYFHHIPITSIRGAHAHKELEQVVIALSGNFEIVIDDGNSQQSYLLNHPQQGLYIGTMVWRELRNFSPNSICLVLASEFYNEADYIRDYNHFINLKKSP